MDVLKLLVELREELGQVEATIGSLERLAMGRSKRRGRPPAWMTKISRTVSDREPTPDIVPVRFATDRTRSVGATPMPAAVL
jgi:hypothetical protein